MLGTWCAGQAEFCGASNRADQIAPAATWTWISGYGFRCEQDPTKGGLQTGCWKQNQLVQSLQ